MKVKDYKELIVWQKGIEIVKEVYSLSRKLPGEELYGLSSQMRRAAVSVPANIAEGFMRNSTKEYKQFIYVSLASCAEIETHLIIAEELGYLCRSMLEKIYDKLNHEIRILRNLIKSLS